MIFSHSHQGWFTVDVLSTCMLWYVLMNVSDWMTLKCTPLPWKTRLSALREWTSKECGLVTLTPAIVQNEEGCTKPALDWLPVALWPLQASEVVDACMREQRLRFSSSKKLSAVRNVCHKVFRSFLEPFQLWFCDWSREQRLTNQT